MNPQNKPLTSILVKPAGPDCNLACRYCFYLEKAGLFSETAAHRMSFEVLEEMIRQVMQQAGQQVSFGWQGGEPTLMGLDFFKKAVEYQKKFGRGQTVGNGLQTNGILLNSEWAQFLKSYQFLVGLSLDGPEHIHNRYRVFKSGRGSWSTVVDRAKMLLDNGVSVNALSVLNDYSVRFPEEIYKFHKALKLNFMQFIPCVEPDKNDPGRAAAFSVSAEGYGRFLIKLFDLWINDFQNGAPTTSIRYFDSVFYSYVGMPPPECTLHRECGVYVVVEHDGSVYSCDFYVEPKWNLGNVMEDRLIDLLNSEKQNYFGRIKAAVPDECRTCRWLTYCRGGCPKDRQNDPDDCGSNHFCKSYQMFFEHAHATLLRMADNWKRQQIAANQTTAKNAAAPVRKTGPNEPCPCGSEKKFEKCCGRI